MLRDDECYLCALQSTGISAYLGASAPISARLPSIRVLLTALVSDAEGVRAAGRWRAIQPFARARGSMLARRCALTALLWLSPVTTSCPLRPETKVVVFADTAAGTGALSAQWERKFWNWWAANSSDAPAHQFIDSVGLHGCSAGELLAAGTVLMPGGNAYIYTQHLGVKVKSELKTFVRRGGLYIGTCAGWYYASSGYCASTLLSNCAQRASPLHLSSPVDRVSSVRGHRLGVRPGLAGFGLLAIPGAARRVRRAR